MNTNPYGFLFDFLNCPLSEHGWQKELRPLFPRRFLMDATDPEVQSGSKIRTFPLLGKTPEALHVQFTRKGIRYAPALTPDQNSLEKQSRLSQNQLWRDMLADHLEKWRTWQSDLRKTLTFPVGKQRLETEKENTFLKSIEEKYLTPLIGPIAAQQRGDMVYRMEEPCEILFVALLELWKQYGYDGIRICPSCGKFFPHYTHRRKDYCSPQCRDQAKPSRQKNKEYLHEYRQRKDQQDIAKIQQASESGGTRDRKKIAQLAGVGPRRVLWLLKEYNITL